MTMKVEFKRSHPKFAYFVGDIADIENEKIERLKLIDDGFVVPYVNLKAKPEPKKEEQ